MLKRIFLIFGFVIVLVSCGNENKPAATGISIKDDLGISHTFDKIPQRIITLAPNLTEMIYDLGLGAKLVGNTIYCDYPEAARKVEKVGNLLTVDFEKIVQLKPDLVLITVEGNTKETYDKFHQLGIEIFVSNPRNFEGIKKTYSDLGRIFRKESAAQIKIAKWDSVITTTKELSKNFPAKSAMFIVDLKPLMLAGGKTFLNEFMEMCGLENIAAESPINYPMFSREEILKRNPDYIIMTAGDNENISRIKSAYPEWLHMKAIENNNVFFVDRDLFSRPGPRFAEAVSDLFKILHPSEKAVRKDQQ